MSTFAEHTYGKHLVVMVATNDEFAQLVRAFDPNERARRNLEGHVPLQKEGRDVVLAKAPQMGMPASAATAMHLIHLYRPKYLAMSGIMAGMEGSVDLGDIVVADPSYDYGSGKLPATSLTTDGGGRLQNEIRQERLSDDIRRVIDDDLARDRGFRDQLGKEAMPDYGEHRHLKIHIGAVGSGAAVVEDPDLLKSLREHQDRKLLGLEMEIYGVMYAASHCNQPRPKVVCAKTVSDFARPGRERSFQPPAAYLSALFIRELIARMD